MTRHVSTKAVPVVSAGVCVIPHPEKEAKGGEDAHYVSPACNVLAIADGVGGWNYHGVDPALFARGLMRSLESVVAEKLKNASEPTTGLSQASNSLDPQRKERSAIKQHFLEPKSLLREAYERFLEENVRGSSTACVLVFSPLSLNYANLGDSGFMVVSDGKVCFRTHPQQKGRTPYQLSSKGDQYFTVDQADVSSCPVHIGDTIVIGTDGLFDNMFDEEIASLVGKNPASTSAELAKLIAQTAFAHSNGEEKTPFASSEGKPDDITVVVAKLGHDVESTKN